MTKKEVKQKLKENGRTWKEFLEWMIGQTVGIYPNGETDFYKYDVERFINNKPIID